MTTNQQDGIVEAVKMISAIYLGLVENGVPEGAAIRITVGLTAPKTHAHETAAALATLFQQSEVT
jgi:hypothetical protein